MSYPKTYERLGRDTLLVNWPDRIDPEMIREIDTLRGEILAFGDYIRSCYHAYHSLAVVFDTSKSDHQSIIDQIKSIEIPQSEITYQSHRIPVCYEEKMAADLSSFCRTKQLSQEELITMHTASQYMVYFFGFLPGFMYLGGLDEKLSLPRKSNPSQNIAPGSVAIGGSQTGIYPTSSPGGWHVIGRTPIGLFNVENQPPCPIAPGDQIEFYPITSKEFAEMERNQDPFTQTKKIHG